MYLFRGLLLVERLNAGPVSVGRHLQQLVWASTVLAADDGVPLRGWTLNQQESTEEIHGMIVDGHLQRECLVKFHKWVKISYNSICETVQSISVVLATILYFI